jgi:hypothetical protein
MDRILVAGYACIVLAFLFAYLTVMREREPKKRPCAFCGKLLSPPVYSCSHYLENAPVRTSPPEVAAESGPSSQELWIA